MEEYSFKDVHTNNTNSINNTIGNNNSSNRHFHSNNSNNDNFNTGKFEETNNELQLSQMTNMSERTKNLFQKEMNNFATDNSVSTNKMNLSINNQQ